MPNPNFTSHSHGRRCLNFFWKTFNLRAVLEISKSELLRLRWHASVCKWLLASGCFYSPRQVVTVTSAASLITLTHNPTLANTHTHTHQRHLCAEKFCVCVKRSGEVEPLELKSQFWKPEVACAKETSTEPERKWPIRVALYIQRQRGVYAMCVYTGAHCLCVRQHSLYVCAVNWGCCC